jgi:hypothetical protein
VEQGYREACGQTVEAKRKQVRVSERQAGDKRNGATTRRKLPKEHDLTVYLWVKTPSTKKAGGLTVDATLMKRASKSRLHFG